MAISFGCKGNSNSLKHAILFLIILLFSARVCCDEHPSASKRSNCLESERRALLAIKSDLYNSDHWLSSWIGYDCCMWRGVACDNTTNHVIRLDLHYPIDQYDLSPNRSKVNPSLFELKNLKYLNLSFNNFSTHVPSMISSLVHLEYLDLSNANFNGLLPQQLSNLSDLRFLDLSCCFYWHPNQLWSNDLSWLSNLTSLEYLDMSCVNLSTTTNWLHQINYNSLEHLALSYCWPQDAIGADTNNLSNNQIEGNISVNAARKLKHLELARNSLSKIPLNLESLFHLEYLDLYWNYITEEMFLSIGNLIHLEYLDLSWNRITEVKLLSMGNLIHLEDLDLSWNHITEVKLLSMGNLSRLEHLNLNGNDITGEIPLSIGNLIHLKYLDLSQNYITGEIPQSMGNLVHLEYLVLSDNRITGAMPLSMGNLSSLLHLDVSSNEFSGCILNFLSNLVNLEELFLSYNNISCSIPKNISRLHNLRYFHTSMNNLMGQISSSLGDLCNLKSLDLSLNNIYGELTNLLDGLSQCPQGSNLQALYIYGNKLSGSIPSSLGQLAQLHVLDISRNSLQGNITEAHFSQLTNLWGLDISYNSLNLILSDDWLPPFDAVIIDMSYCHLGTRFPSWIQTQTNLQRLDLSGVRLHGKIPSWFSEFIFNNSQFYLDISSNNLNGQIPSSLPAYMDLSNNSFEGMISLSYANFEHVQVLKLSNNHIHGSLPVFFCNFTNLYILQLSNNYLSSEVPNCHESYPIHLESLHLNNNNLSGPFPSFLKNCNELGALDLGGNRFSGEIPKWVGRSFPWLKVLRLSSNSFSHSIPVNIGNLTSLQVLDLSSNKFIGSIPSSIANFGNMSVKQNYTSYGLYRNFKNFRFDACNNSNSFYCTDGDMEYIEFDSLLITAKGLTNEYTKALSDVTSIDLSNNELSGEIPKEITNLHGLCFLNLSNNHLTGRIPENISTITELQSLDLSMNHLTGEIPFSLSSLTFLSFLNLSYNNLSGRIPIGGQFSTFNESIYAGNKGLCGVPLPQCPSDDTDHLPSQIGENEDGDKLETILNYTFIVMGFIAGFWAYFGMIIMKKSIKVTLFESVDKMYDRMYVQLSLKIAKLNMKWQK